MFQKPFSFSSRIRRTEYGISAIIFLITAIIVNSIGFTGGAASIIYFAYFPLLWFILAQGAKRCHDRGNNGWYQIIPLYVFWMIFADSKTGINKYGLNPKGFGNSEKNTNDQKEQRNIPPSKIESESKPDTQQIEENAMNTPPMQIISKSASIKIILADIKGVFGSMKITFILDGKPLKPITLGGTSEFAVSSGQHTIQTVTKARSFYTLFISITRRSKILTLITEPNTQVTVMATYNKTLGNFEIKPVIESA
jgi:uncharacterized membrane protein YhaH (DUF805 family)